jgi:hypothetical protein
MRRLLYLAILLALPVSGNIRADEVTPAFDAFFRKAATLEGQPYVLARDQLVRRGKAVLPLAEKYAASTDWQQWCLAETIRLHVTRSNEVSLWRFAITHRKVDLREDGDALMAHFNGAFANNAEQEGVELPSQPIELPPETVPIALELLCEHKRFAANGHTYEMGVIGKALIVLKHFAHPRSAEPLVLAADQLHRAKPPLQAIVIKIGDPALPALHRAIETKNREWHASRRAMFAAQALGEIGDDESAELLAKTVDQVAWADAVPVYCAAIAKLKHKRAAKVIFKQLVDAATGWPNRKVIVNSTSTGYYESIRRTLLSLSGPVELLLSERMKTDPSPRVRAIAASLLSELRKANAESVVFPSRYGPDDSAHIEGPLLLERAVVRPNSRTLRALGRLKGNELAVELLEWELLTGPRAAHAQPWTVLALAEVAGSKAIDTYLQRSTAHPTRDAPGVLEALVFLNDSAGVKLLDRWLADEKPFSHAGGQDLAANARLVRGVLSSEDRDSAELLSAHSVSLRLAAARALAARRDLRAIDVLFPAAVAWSADPREANQTDEDYLYSVNSHQAARQALVELGEKAIPAIEKAAKDSDARYAKLLADSLILRVRRPELVRKFEQANAIRSPGWTHILGPTVDDFRFAGREVAEKLGPEAASLLASAIVWGADRISPPVAAFALAHLKHDASIPIISKNAAKMGYARGEGLASVVLIEFGEKGIVAAKNVPVADSSRDGFRGRVSRHRAATTALAEADLPEGIDGVLAGLKLAANGEIETHRTNIYLRSALDYQDDRLIDAVIDAVDRQGSEIARSALAVLVKYNNPKIVGVCVRHIDQSDNALLGLLKVKGPAGIQLLLDRLDEPEDAGLEVPIISALVKLRPDPGLHTLAAKSGIAIEDLEEFAPEIRKRLVARTAKASEQRSAAGRALMAFAGSRPDDETIEALLTWVRDNEKREWRELRYLTLTDHDRVKEVFLELYQQSPLTNVSLARCLADLKVEAALPLVVTAIETRLADKNTRDGIAEVACLDDFGPAGCDALFALSEKHSDLRMLLPAFEDLAGRHDQRAFEPGKDLFREMVANGLWDPRVHPYSHRDRSEVYRNNVNTLAETLLRLDDARARPIVTRACLTTTDPQLRDLLARTLTQAPLGQPAPKLVDAPLPDNRLAELEARTEVVTVPLLTACDIWLAAVKPQSNTSYPDERRDAVIAHGEDSLQIGLEIFYRWPQPTADEIVSAIKQLTANDETTRRQATALLAIRPYPAVLLDNALLAADGDNLAIGLAIRRWRQRGGELLDADNDLRRRFTLWMLENWSIDELRQFTLPRLDRMAQIDHEEYMWTEKPIYPMLASLRYSTNEEDLKALREFGKRAKPVPAKIAEHVLRDGHRGLTVLGVDDRWQEYLQEQK